MNAPQIDRATREALDAIDEVQSAMRGAADLLMPERDFHCVNRNDVAALFAYLNRQQDKAMEALRSAVVEGGAQ